MTELTQERLKELLHYDPDTGIFTWRVTLGARAKPGGIAGSDNQSGYRHIYINRKCYKAHRLAWLYMVGDWPELILDHINRVGTDNRFANLREVTMAENKQNTVVRKDSKSGIKGVRRSPNARAWVVSICVKGEDHYVGYFRDLNEAKQAYANAASKLHSCNPAATAASRT